MLEPALLGYPVGWFQPTYKSLMEVWRAMKRIVAPITAKGGVNSLDKRIELITGGVLEFWSLDSDPECARGRKYKRVIINEAAKVRNLQTAWELAIRATLLDFKGDAYFPSTPRGQDYYWELFVKGFETENPEWMSWQMPTSENPHIDATEIASMKLEMPSTVFAQEIEAQFLDVAGRFFDEWEPWREVLVDFDAAGRPIRVQEPWHVIDAFPIPSHWKMWGSVDHGTSSHAKTWAFLLFAAGEDGTVYVVDELYYSGKLSTEQAELVIQCLIKWHRARPENPEMPYGRYNCSDIEMIPFDWANTFPPDNKDERKGKYPVEYYWDRGLPCIKAVKDRIAGWRETKQWMHDVVRIRNEEDGEEDVSPKLRVFRRDEEKNIGCPNLIRTIPLMIRDAHKSEDIEEDPLGVTEDEGHLEQHLVDALRYGLMRRPERSAGEPLPPPPPSAISKSLIGFKKPSRKQYA